MATARARHLVDACLGVAVGALSLGAAQVPMGGGHSDLDGTSDGDVGGGFGRHGPGHWPPGPPTDLHPPSAALIGLVLLVAVGVAMRRWRPRTGFALTAVGTAGYLATGHPFGPVMLAPVLALYAVAARLPVRRWIPWWLLVIPTVWAAFVTEPALGLTDPALYQEVLFGAVLWAVPALIGQVRRNRELTQRRTRELELRRSAFEERLRIAREVHDVVGHSLSVITMQAGVALHVLDRHPDQVAPSLQAIRDTSKKALDELRVTLDVFRTADYSPESGLDQLPALIEQFRAGGRSVELIDRRPATLQLPAGVDLAGYRIVQEALTNVARHTRTASAQVSILTSGDQLIVEIVDTGEAKTPPTPAPHPIGPGGGNGLPGMTERAAGVGGTVAAGPMPGGGYRVRAQLPLRAAEGGSP